MSAVFDEVFCFAVVNSSRSGLAPDGFEPGYDLISARPEPLMARARPVAVGTARGPL
jgi:hypothetical protein